MFNFNTCKNAHNVKKKMNNSGFASPTAERCKDI